MQQYKQSEWVSYILTKSNLNSNIRRESYFRVDTMVEGGTAKSSDYTGSNYDRGHMASAADMSRDEKTMYESFYMSNICPQAPNLNRGVWKKLESQGRIWVSFQFDTLYVICGPVLTDSLMFTIGESKVAVPKRFYKVFIYKDHSICFIFNNEKCDEMDLLQYQTTMSEIEKITGLCFTENEKINKTIKETFFFFPNLN